MRDEAWKRTGDGRSRIQQEKDREWGMRDETWTRPGNIRDTNVAEKSRGAMNEKTMGCGECQMPKRVCDEAYVIEAMGHDT